jgi:hypothetical protein
MPLLKITILIDDEVVIHGHSIELAFKLLCSVWIFMSSTLRTPKLLVRFKCEYESENNEKIRSWDALLNSQHFGGKKGVLELWDRD